MLCPRQSRSETGTGNDPNTQDDAGRKIDMDDATILYLYVLYLFTIDPSRLKELNEENDRKIKAKAGVGVG